jgi:2-hydroxychromene-2-carboxylate isomerase
VARVHFFHDPDDPYSQLAAQLLQPLAARYRIVLDTHRVTAPADAAVPDRPRLRDWARRDAAQLAARRGLAWPPAPNDARNDAPDGATDAGAGTARASNASRASHTSAAAQGGDALRTRLGHYLGGTFFFEGEWYWGVDRLHFLEERLRAAGLCVAPGEPLVAPVVDVACPPVPAGLRHPDLHFFLSLRSPYTYLAVPRVRRLAAHYGARLHLRFVLPMVMRGLPVPRDKRLYIVRDAKREADRLGMRFGNIADPVGKPAERGLAVLHRAIAVGNGERFAESFLQGVFADGIDAGSRRGLQQIAARAGLDTAFVTSALADESWRAVAEANRHELLSLGLWGVPSFRVDDRPPQWGQDRLWAVEHDLQAATGHPADRCVTSPAVD